jgi:hypothetical protein
VRTKNTLFLGQILGFLGFRGVQKANRSGVDSL